MSAGISIRQAKAHDVDACSRLYVEIGRQHFAWRESEYFQASEFLKFAQGETVWIACQGREIGALLTYFEPEHFLHFLMVGKNWRRQGVGSALLNQVRSHYGKPHTLKVDGPNVDARRYYVARGYTQRCVGKSDGIAWILMESP